jgi:protein-disulfide isomerase
MRLKFSVVLVLLFALTFAVFAQDEEETTEFQDLYSEVPTVRGEDGAFILGDPDAPVTVIEFADFLCPACQQYQPTITTFIEDYVLTGQAKFEYRFFLVIDPFLSGLSAAVGECAYEQGAFWTVNKELYRLAEAREIDENLISVIAENVGLDEAQLDTCVNEPRFFQYQEDIAYGQDLSVSSTPSIRVKAGDGLAGVLVVGDMYYDRSGVSVATLAEFVASETPEDHVLLVNQVLNDENSQDTSLIDDEDCAAPCWRGIVPGETTLEDAIAILEAQDDLGELNIQSNEVATAITFGDPLCCQLVSQDNQTVTLFQLNTAPLMTLGAVIERYGEPDLIEGAVITRSQTVHNLYFLDHNIVLFVFAEGADAPLSEESPIVGTVYVDPALYAEVLAGVPLSSWNGYQALSDYDLPAEPMGQ